MAAAVRLTPNVGPTYWYEPEYQRMVMGEEGRVTEAAGWAFATLTGPWTAGQFARNSTFNAGFEDYDLARRKLHLAPGVFEAEEALRAYKSKGGLVVVLAQGGSDFAFMLFPIGRGRAPDIVGPNLFAAWKSKQAEKAKWSNKPKIWPL